jgi:hypothetical protein
MQLTLGNIGKLFLGKESGPFINSLDKLYQGVLPGVRAYPINIPGFAYHHALKVHVFTKFSFHSSTSLIQLIFFIIIWTTKKIGTKISDGKIKSLSNYLFTKFSYKISDMIFFFSKYFLLIYIFLVVLSLLTHVCSLKL